jgi:hypothetical protein
MKPRYALSLIALPFFLLACTKEKGGGNTQGCVHGTGGVDCIPMDCSVTPPDPDPQSCTSAADCKQPESVCYLQSYCDDGPGYLNASYSSPTCEAGTCTWKATTSAPDGTCPSTMPAAGTPCDASGNCSVDGPCTYTATQSCGQVEVSPSCDGGVWKLRSVCDCAGADQASCGENPYCQWRSPYCFEIQTAYCAPLLDVACGSPGCASCGLVTQKPCSESSVTVCPGCGVPPDMACVP